MGSVPDIELRLEDGVKGRVKKFNICLCILLDLNRVVPSVVPRACK
jgi:hypothetical protein